MLDSYLAIAEHPLLWVFLGLTVVFFLIQQQVSRPKSSKWPIMEHLGMSALPKGLFILGALVWTLLLGAAVFGLLFAIWRAIFPVVEAGTEVGDDLRWSLLTITALTAMLGAVVAFPFTLIRIQLTRKQTETGEQGHITDRINKAVEGLGASKEVNRLGRNLAFTLDDGEIHNDFEWKSEPLTLPKGATLDAANTREWKNVTLSEPNLEVRIGAIYALERIAQDSDRDHVQIMEILCAYIRQNAPSDVEPWPELELDFDEHPGTPEDLEQHISHLHKAHEHLVAQSFFREDLQTALDVIGRRTETQRRLENPNEPEKRLPEFTATFPHPKDFLDEKKFRAPAYRLAVKSWKDALLSQRGYLLNLRGSNLNLAHLSERNFDCARMYRARFNGASLINTRLIGADIGATEFSHARLHHAKLLGADMQNANLQGATLLSTWLCGSLLWRSKMDAADMPASHLQGATLSDATLIGANLDSAELWGASFNQVDMRHAKLPNAQFWDATLKRVDLRGAELAGASFRRSGLFGIRMDQTTTLTGAAFHGAAVRSVDAATLEQLNDHLPAMFSDGSLKLPEGVERPSHWAKQVLDKEQFEDRWQAWLATADLDALAGETG